MIPHDTMFPLDVLINFHYNIFTVTAAAKVHQQISAARRPVVPVHNPRVGHPSMIQRLSDHSV